MGNFYSGTLEFNDSAVARHQNAHLTEKRFELCTFPVGTNDKKRKKEKTVSLLHGIKVTTDVTSTVAHH